MVTTFSDHQRPRLERLAELQHELRTAITGWAVPSAPVRHLCPPGPAARGRLTVFAFDLPATGGPRAAGCRGRSSRSKMIATVNSPPYPFSESEA
jgi:hypothetical protein